MELVYFIIEACVRAASMGVFLPSLLAQVFVTLAFTQVDGVRVLCCFSSAFVNKLAVSDQSEQLPIGIFLLSP